MEAGPRDDDGTPVRGVPHARAGSAAHDVPSPSVSEPAEEPGPEPALGPGGLPEGEGDDAAGVNSVDGVDGDEAVLAEPVEPQELRPARKLRLWQLAPVVFLCALGSLMFAFPLAFEPGGGSSTGAVVSMLGLLLCGCGAGWGVMAARRVGHTWPGLPARGSGRQPDWRVVLVYAVIVCTLVVLAFWRVDRLR